MAKLEILNAVEQADFDSPPKFSTLEQKKYFQLPAALQTWLTSVTSPTYKVGFILLWGYCRASLRFFHPKQFSPHDVAMVCAQEGIPMASVELSAYNQRTCNFHKNTIRAHLPLHPFKDEVQAFFSETIKDKVARRQSPRQILKGVQQLMKAKQYEVPSYNRFTLVITQAISDFEKSLAKLFDKPLSDDNKASLDTLLKVDESPASVMTQLKAISHSKKPKAIKESVQKFQLIKALYEKHFLLVEPLNLHADTIKHYANWVNKASLYQITQLQISKRYLYIICFIAHQYQLRQDILSDTLLSCVKATGNAIAKSQKEQAYKHTESQKQALNLLSSARISYKSVLKEVEEVTASLTIDANEKIERIKYILKTYHQQADEPKLDNLTQTCQAQMQARDYFTVLESLSLKLQNRVADIMRHMSFDGLDSGETSSPPLLTAIKHYQSKGGTIGKDAPIEFLGEKEKEALLHDEGKFRVSLYKAMLYFHTADALKSGVLSLASAYRYLSLEKYLHPKNHWDDHKARLLEEAGLTGFLDIDSLLNILKKRLHGAYHKTNRRIKEDLNAHIKFNAKNQMILSTPKVEKIKTQHVSSLFADCKPMSILQILNDIQNATNYLGCFQHHSVKDKKVMPTPSLFYASILSLGCNIGHPHMANISRGITEDSLLSLINWHMNLENSYAANARILDLSSQLALVKMQQKNQGELHTSSDGRKVSVSVDSLNANESFKYFGDGKGVSVYSFIDELDRLFYSTAFSSAEREAAYVVDGLMHNLSIKSDIHSTDTHGYSEAIFGILFLLNTFFAPRIKNVKKATLYSFDAASRKAYKAKDYKILPTRYIDTDLIKTHWDDILRLMVTVKLKETTASQLFKRLSSYAKQNPLYCAIKEFGRIIKTLFVLRYIDEVELRQNIEKQLNKIELSNKFAKAISFGDNQEIHYSSKEEQEMVVACQSLIQNAIVLWGELYLSQKLANTEDEQERERLLTIIRNGSLLIWQYVNFHGEYDFTQDTRHVKYLFDMEKILALTIQ